MPELLSVYNPQPIATHQDIPILPIPVISLSILPSCLGQERLSLAHNPRRSLTPLLKGAVRSARVLSLIQRPLVQMEESYTILLGMLSFKT
jgi:hypothetical protein